MTLMRMNKMALFVEPYPMTYCPECERSFIQKKGKKYCSDKCRKRANGRVNDAKRLPQQIEKGRLYRADHPTYDRDRMRRVREKYGRNDGKFAKLLIEAMHPLNIVPKGDACFVAGDVHVPFYLDGYLNFLLDMSDETGVRNLAIPGDFLDADAYSKWPKIAGVGESFKTELEYAGIILSILAEKFDHIYICRGNHENRIIYQNNGQMDMKELMELSKAPSCVEWTNDTYMNMFIKDDEWLLCHPMQFRQTPGSVARDLCAKYHKNVVSAHGHFFCQNYDRSGKFYALDGGGLFDAAALAYLRNIRTTPWTANGFYLIDESGFIPYSLGTGMI
jgi:hypothetical protein